MTTDIIAVPFHGDEVECARDDAGTVWVTLAPLCARLGDLEVKGQVRKLREISHMARVEKISTRRSDGQIVDAWAVDLDGLAPWLMSISLNRVAPDVRPGLASLQRDGARVLRDHFFPRASTPRPPPVLTIDAAPQLSDDRARQAGRAVELALKAGDLTEREAARRHAAIIRASTGFDVLADPGGSWAKALPEVADLPPGGSLTITRNVDTAGHHSASAIGKPFGLSGTFVGDKARELGIHGQDGWGMWRRFNPNDGADGFDHWLYNDRAKAHLEPLLRVEQGRRRAAADAKAARAAAKEQKKAAKIPVPSQSSPTLNIPLPPGFPSAPAPRGEA